MPRKARTDNEASAFDVNRTFIKHAQTRVTVDPQLKQLFLKVQLGCPANKVGLKAACY